jgi:hypothetical protein
VDLETSERKSGTPWPPSTAAKEMAAVSNLKIELLRRQARALEIAAAIVAQWTRERCLSI